jgi:hypothetical protein
MMGRMFFKVIIGLGFLVGWQNAAGAQVNLLINAGFENGPTYPARADGNLFVNMNTDGALGWLRSGPVAQYWTTYNSGVAKFNIVQVDGPGGFSYGISGNESDATGQHMMNRRRHYLDMMGNDIVYQSFTAPCTGPMKFGAWFSTRINGEDGVAVEIVNGNNPLQIPTVATAGTPYTFWNIIYLVWGAHMPSWPTPRHSNIDSWQKLSGSFNAVRNSVYFFRIRLSDNMSVDEAFLAKDNNCV